MGSYFPLTEEFPYMSFHFEEVQLFVSLMNQLYVDTCMQTADSTDSFFFTHCRPDRQATTQLDHPPVLLIPPVKQFLV